MRPRSWTRSRGPTTTSPSAANVPRHRRPLRHWAARAAYSADSSTASGTTPKPTDNHGFAFPADLCVRRAALAGDRGFAPFGLPVRGAASVDDRAAGDVERGRGHGAGVVRRGEGGHVADVV